MMRPRRATPGDRALLELPSDGFIVTDDVPKSIGAYNCLGSVLGIPLQLGQDGVAYLGEYLTDHPSTDKSLVVVYHGSLGFHFARRLRDPRRGQPPRNEWYESKLGDRFRVVHRRLNMPPGYGSVIGYAVVDEEVVRRAVAQLEEQSASDSAQGLPPLDYDNTIDDSSTIFRRLLWDEIAKLEADGF